MLNTIQVAQKLNFVRMSGTEGEKKAVSIITNYLEQFGINYQIDEFEHFSYEFGKASLSCQNISFKVHPFGLNPDSDVEGKLIFLENLEQIRYNKGAYQDRIILTYNYSRKIANQLDEDGVKALIVINPPFKKNKTSSHRQKLYKEKRFVPSIKISYDEAKKLKKFIGNTVRLVIEQNVTKQKGHNIVATIPGKSYDKNLIYAVGHYDTVGRAVGASDNTGGTATLLKVAEYFSSNRPQRDLKIIFFSGEELGLLGSQAYVKKYKKEIKERASLVVNIDVSGDEFGKDIYNIIGNSKLLGYIDGISKENGLMFKSALDIYSSDCMPFSIYEIPAINIARFGGKALINAHTPDDKLEYITEDGLKNTVSATMTILKRILNAKIFPVNKEIDKELRPKIEKYLFNSTLEKPELNWTPQFKK